MSDDLIVSVMNDIGASVISGAGTDLQLWSLSGDVDIATAALTDSGIATTIERDGIIEHAANSVQLHLVEPPSPPPLTASAIPNDPGYSNTWGMNAISAPNAWSRETGSSSVIVGVIDSGIDIDHPDLINNLWVNTGEIWGDGIDNDGNGYVDDYHGYDFVHGRGIGPGYAESDEDGHGTHVAGTIAAQGNNAIGVAGVAWDAQLMAAKFLNADGLGSVYGATAAIRYTVDNGARISNNSWGGTYNSSQISAAVHYAQQAGQLFVATAGNDGWDNDQFNAYPADYTYDNIISVAASTSSGAKAGFSNFGDISVDLAAPGSSIYSTTEGGGYGYLNDTSMASPHVAGAAALLLSAAPNLTYQELRRAILDFSTHSSQWTGLTATEGILNVDAALASVGPLTSISISSSSINENVSGAVIGGLSAPDSARDVTYSIDQDLSGFFEIRGNSLALKSGVSLDHEAASTHSLILRGTDSGGTSATRNVTISVGDLNEAPTSIGGNGNVSVSENAATGTVLGTYAAHGDPDDGDTATYSLTQTANGLFAIDAATGVLSTAGALDYETASSHSVTIRATDSGRLSVDRAITVVVNDENDAPIVSFERTPGKLYFVGEEAATGRELYSLDQSGQVTRLSDINPESANFEIWNDGAQLGQKYYFRGRKSEGDVELFSIDFATNTVSLEADIQPGTGSGNPLEFVEYRDALYFSASDGVSGRELYRISSDGSVQLVEDIFPGDWASNPGQLAVFNDNLYFHARNTRGTAYELFRLGPDDVLTQITSGDGYLSALGFTAFNEHLYFSAHNNGIGRELYRLDANDNVELDVRPESSSMFR